MEQDVLSGHFGKSYKLCKYHYSRLQKQYVTSGSYIKDVLASHINNANITWKLPFNQALIQTMCTLCVVCDVTL